MAESIRVFISYSQDKPGARRACSTAGRGRRGLHSRSLQRRPAARLAVAEQIEQSAFVECDCSKTYPTSFEGKNCPDKGLGVSQEGYCELVRTKGPC